MLGRQVLNFLPAQAVPALAAFAGVYVFTRVATPAEYGLYALVLSVAQMCQTVLFYWIQVGATRHIESARRDATLPALESAVYRSHATTCALFAAGYTLAIGLLPLGAPLRHALWYALLIVGLRSLVQVNQAFHRGAMRAGRYNLIECTQAVAQLGFGLALLLLTRARTDALLLGTVLASLLVVSIDLPAVGAALRRPVERQEVATLLRFGLPLSVSFALNYILATSDRLLVEYFLGSGAVGVYAIAYGLMDRSLSSLFVAVSLVAFPLAIRALERDGTAAATAQLRDNGRLLLAIALPACTLLICLNGQLAAVMVGSAFRAEAEAIMPWVAVATLLAGFQIHFFDHAFHLSRRTTLFFWSTGPAALLNIVANVLLLPRYGLMGAVWATLASYAVSLAASIAIGRRVLAVPLDLAESVRVGVACAALALAVRALDPPPTLGGLVAGTAVALLAYAVAGVALDIARVRSPCRRAGRHGAPDEPHAAGSAAAPVDLHPELHRRRGRTRQPDADRRIRGARGRCDRGRAPGCRRVAHADAGGGAAGLARGRPHAHRAAAADRLPAPRSARRVAVEPGPQQHRRAVGAGGAPPRVGLPDPGRDLPAQRPHDRGAHLRQLAALGAAAALPRVRAPGRGHRRGLGGRLRRHGARDRDQPRAHHHSLQPGSRCALSRGPRPALAPSLAA